MVAAMQRSGRSDIPPADLGEPLAVLTRALDRQADLTLDGRRAAREALVAALVARAEIDAADAPPTVPDLVVVGLPHGAAGALSKALGVHTEAAPPLGPGDDAAAWRYHLADPSWELRWHVPDFAEWLDERRGALAPPPTLHRCTGGLAWCWSLPRSPSTRLVVVRDRGELATEAVRGLTQATLAERSRHSHRQRPQVVERYVRWRMAAVSDLLEAAAAQADLVLDGSSVSDDPARAAAAVSALLETER